MQTRMALGKWFRWVGAALVCVVTGVLASVTIAWLIENHGPPFYFASVFDQGGPMVDAEGHVYDGWFRLEPGRRGVSLTRVLRTSGTESFSSPPRWAVLPERLGMRVVTQVFGWPAQCLRWESVQPQVGAAFGRTHVILVRPLGHVVQFSYGVMWVGLLADTCVYTALAGVTWCVACRWRRSRRRAGNRCVSCGYDRRGLAADAKCPECGTVSAPAAQ